MAAISHIIEAVASNLKLAKNLVTLLTQSWLLPKGSKISKNTNLISNLSAIAHGHGPYF